jgi:predicted transcriptional regulator
MQQIIPSCQIRDRLAKLSLSANEFGRRCGVHHTTLLRVMSGEISPNLATMQKITEALLASELALLAHLQALHPEPEHGHGEAE